MSSQHSNKIFWTIIADIGKMRMNNINVANFGMNIERIS